MRPFLRSKKNTIGRDLTPLIDVIFQLLLFFMLTSSYIKPSIPLKLPQASNKDKLKEQDIILTVNKDETVYLNNRQVSLDSLEAELKGALSKDKDRRVIFQGDENILYKKFVAVMDKAKAAGVKNINIAHEVKKTE
jgi:biopolymer transport protein ExbD